MYICIHINLNTVYLRIRKQVLNLYGKLFNRQCNVICPRCSVTSDNIAVHKLQYCCKNENVRLDLWQSLITHLKSEHVLNITELPPEWRILEMLCSFTTRVLRDNLRLMCFRVLYNRVHS